MRFASALFLCVVALERAKAGTLDETLEVIRTKHEVVALGGAIVTLDGATERGAAGVRRAGGAERVTDDDLWHLGSCTKSMTATLLARLSEQGKLRLDLTLKEALHDLALPMHEGFREVTLDLLLRNRGGIPADLTADDLWGRLWRHRGPLTEQRRMIATEVLARAPALPPRVTFLYSNAGFAIAGHVAESHAKLPWEELIRRDLFDPLGMKSVGFGAPGDAQKVDQPWGHQIREGRPLPIPPGPAADNPPSIGPAGTVHASLADWGRYVALHLHEATGTDLLTGPGLKNLHAARDGEDYAMGWIVAHRPWGGRVLTHAGSNTLWYCVAWLAPERGFAVLATCNQGGDSAAKACDDVASALISRHLTAKKSG